MHFSTTFGVLAMSLAILVQAAPIAPAVETPATIEARNIDAAPRADDAVALTKRAPLDDEFPSIMARNANPLAPFIR